MIDPKWDGATVRNYLLVERQRQHVLAGRGIPAVDPFRAALILGTAVRFTAADGSCWVLDDTNKMRELTAHDAGLPSAETQW